MFEIKKVTDYHLKACNNCCAERDLTEINIGVNDRFTRMKLFLCNECLKEFVLHLNKKIKL